jgi:hypothetical protein
MYSIPDELDRLSTIFAILNFEMSITAKLSLLRPGKLRPEAVISARVCSKDSAIERGASSELMIDSVWPALYRLSVSTEPVSCLLASP